MKNLDKRICMLYVITSLVVIIVFGLIIKDTQSQLSDIKSSQESNNLNYTELQATVENLEKEDKETLVTRINQLQSKAESLVEQNNTLIDENESLLNENAQLRQDVETLQGTVETLQGNVQTLQKSVDTLKSKINKLETATPKVDAEQTVEEIKVEPAKEQNLPISVNGNVSDSFYNNVVKYYNLVPQNVKDSFVNNGWQIIVTDQKLTLNGISQRIQAYTVYNNKTIYIGTVDASSTVHEIGHYVDYLNDFASNSMSDETFASEVPGLKKIDGKTDSHNYSSKVEFFAECFFMYFLDNTGLKTNCPNTYALVEQLISNL